MKRRGELSEVLWALAIFVVVVMIVVLAIRRSTHDKEDCEAGGGTVVHIHNSQTGEWFCQEPRP